MSDASKIVDTLVDRTDYSQSEIEERIDAKAEDMADNQAADIKPEELRDTAAVIVKNDIINISSGGYEGDVEELPFLTIGFRRKEGDYFVTEGNAIIGLALVNPVDSPAGVAVVLIDEADGLDLDYAAETFAPLNTVRGYATLSQVGSIDSQPTIRKGGKPTYICRTTSESKFEEVNPADCADDDVMSEIPPELEEKRDMLNIHFFDDDETVNLQNYAEHETVLNESGWEEAFGVDVKRFRGTVVSAYRDYEKGFGVMTLMDGTVFDEDEVSEELVDDDMRVPGLKVWGEPEMIQSGEESLLDVYGFIRQNPKTGQYTMQGYGAVPIIDYPYTEGQENENEAEEDGWNN